MRSFVCAALLFSIMLGFIIFNYFRINSISDRLIEQVSTLPTVGGKERFAACVAVRDTWNASRDLISFSCGISRLDAIEDLLDALILYSSTELSEDFELTRIRLINALEGIAEFESFRPENIF